MRVLIVTEHYWPEDFRITDLSIALRERGHEVSVLTGMPSYPRGRYFDGYGLAGPYAEVHEGVRVCRVPIVPRGRGRAWQLAMNYASYILAAGARIPWFGRWDVVLVFQPSPVTTCIPALVLRSMARTPVAMWVQDLWPETLLATGMVRAGWLFELAKRLSHLLYRKCDLLLGQSRAFLPRLARAGVSQDRLEYLPNWAEDHYKHEVRREEPTAPWERGFAVMFAGNLGRVQALDTVLAAAVLTRDDPEIRWVLVGDGPMRETLAAAVEREGLGESVYLLGRKPAAEMPALFARAGALLVSLKADDVMALTIPSKVQSYLAAGRPIIGSLDGEGATVIEESGAGWCAAAGDAAGLAAVVRRMKSAGAAERERMGRAGRAYYDREFDRSLCIDRLEASLLRLAGARA